MISCDGSLQYIGKSTNQPDNTNPNQIEENERIIKKAQTK